MAEEHQQGNEMSETGGNRPKFIDEEPDSTGEERIGFGKRLGAYLLDAVFSGILGLIVMGSVGMGDAMHGAGMEEQGDPGMMMRHMVEGGSVWVAVMGVLYWLIEGFTGASPGKMILGIQIRSENAEPAPQGTLVSRALIKAVSSIGTLLTGITGVMAFTYLGMVCGLIVFVGCFFALGASRQALHDQILRTAVYGR